MNRVAIEAEKVADADGVDGVVRRAFAHHPEVADMVAAIRRTPRYRPPLAFVARSDDAVVGFVMLSGTDLVDGGDRPREVLTLTPLAVDPEFQGRGIGSALVHVGLAEADRGGEPLVVVEGSASFYGRLGFERASFHGVTMDLPSWAPPESAQVYLLSGYDPQVRGCVVYPPAIAATLG